MSSRNQSADQMSRVLTAIRRVERRTDLIPFPSERTFRIQGFEAIADDADVDAIIDRIPFDATLPPPHGPVAAIRATTAATVIRLSKFSHGECIRARAFYPNTAPPVTMKLVLGVGDARSPVTADISARSALGERLPAPPLLDSGVHRTMAYLIEPILFGSHPTSGHGKQNAAETLIRRLLEAHRHAGLSDKRPHLHHSTFDRLAELFGRIEWHDHWPRPDVLREACLRVVDSGAKLATGWCHGDPVFSNVIVDEAGAIHLIDWEHAHVGPVAADLAKLISASYRPEPVLSVLEAEATSADVGVRPGRHTVRHQLAVVLIRELSWWKRRARRAETTGRQLNFDAWIDRSIDLLVAVL